MPHYQLNETFGIYEKFSEMVKDIYVATDAKLRSMDDINARLMGKRFAKDPILLELHDKRCSFVRLMVEQHRNGVTLDKSYKPSGGLKLTSREFSLKYLAERDNVDRSLRLLRSQRL